MEPRETKAERLERIATPTPQSEFREYYNDNIPKSFPKATPDDLKEFKSTHSSLFEGTKGWVIEKHRKRLMDWLSGRATK